jgi:ATP-binding cassette subfamily B protein
MSSVAAAARLSIAAGDAPRASGRQAWSLLWASSRRLGVLVIAWTSAQAAVPALVVIALGSIVGHIPAAIESGLGSTAGHRLIEALVLAALVYAFSLILDPIGAALGTAAKARVTGDLQHRLLTAVSEPVGVGHLEDGAVLDRLARAEGGLTGFFPGDAPVTWAGVLSTRIGGLLGCLTVATFRWWLGLLLAVMWLAVRKVMLTAVIRQATQLRGQTTTMRRSWYFLGLGTTAKAAKDVRVFGLGDFVGERFHREHRAALAAGEAGLRQLHLRAVGCWLVVLAGYSGALFTIAEAGRDHTITLRALAILLPMLAVTMSTGSVNLDDITLVWTLAGLPDVDTLESELGTAHQGLDGDRDPDGGRLPLSERHHQRARRSGPGAGRRYLDRTGGG